MASTDYVSLPVPVVRDLGKKLFELEEIIESIEIMSDKKLIAGIKQGENDISQGRFKEIKNPEEL